MSDTRALKCHVCRAPLRGTQAFRWDGAGMLAAHAPGTTAYCKSCVERALFRVQTAVFRARRKRTARP